jgi:hypothetical protein
MRGDVFLCRFGNQDWYRIRGRDPIKHPMTALERAVFLFVLNEWIEKENPPEDELPREIVPRRVTDT